MPATSEAAQNHGITRAAVNPPLIPRQRAQVVSYVTRTCATCSYLSSTDCTNLDGPLQTTANSPACRLYFCIGDVERGL